MKIHIVKKGESLYGLSQKYGVELDKLIAANPQITDPNVIDVGQKVKIPHAPKPVAPPPTDYLYKHVVVQGDSLWKLGKAWGVPLADMIAANPQLKNPNVLMTGDVVYIPKPGSNPNPYPAVAPQAPLPVEASPISELPLAPNVGMPNVGSQPEMETPHMGPLTNLGIPHVMPLSNIAQPNVTPYSVQPNIPEPNVTPYSVQPNMPEPNVMPYSMKPNKPEPNVMPYSVQPNMPEPNVMPYSVQPNKPEPNVMPYSVQPNKPEPNVMPYSFQPNMPEPNVMPYSVQPNMPEPNVMPYSMKPNKPEPNVMPYSVQPNKPEPNVMPYSVQPNMPEPNVMPYSVQPNIPQPAPGKFEAQGKQEAELSSNIAPIPTWPSMEQQSFQSPQPFQATTNEPMPQSFSAAQKPQPYEAPQPFQAAQKGKPSEPMPQSFSAAQKPQPYEAPQPFQAAQKEKPSEPALNPYQVAEPQTGYQPFQLGYQPPQPSESLFQQYNVPAVEALAQQPPQPYGKGKENVWKEPELPPIPEMPGTGTMPYFTAPAAPQAYPSLSAGQPPVVKSGCGCGGGLADLPYALPLESPSFAPMPEQASYMPQWSPTAPISLEPPLPQPNIPGPFQPYGYPADEYPLMPFAGPGPMFCEPVVPFHGYPGFPSYPGYVSPAVSPYGSPYPWGQPPVDDKGREGEGKSGKSAEPEKAVISQTDTQSELKAAAPPKRKKKKSSARAALNSLIERNRRQSARSAKPRKPVPWLGN